MLTVLLSAVACQSTEPTSTFVGRGVVKDVRPQARQIVIAHEEIPGFMDAMTMEFEVKEAGLLEGIASGQTVTFTLEKTRDSLYVTQLSPVESPTESVAPPQAAREEDAQAEEEDAQEVSLPEPLPAPDFALTDQDGQPLQLSSLRGKVVVLDFIYTRCPGPCPLLSRKFAHLQKQLRDGLADQVMLLSITIDPEHDTPAVLREYARRYQADTRGWKFLTGSTADIINVAYQYGVDYYGDSSGELNHLVATYIINQQGEVVKVFKGPNHTAGELLAEVQKLLHPAAG
ncbi:MAG: SCO family protein [Candidatus Binatia bacterium]|nr:SCO family protein [Candidatus Binatia bacterium]